MSSSSIFDMLEDPSFLGQILGAGGNMNLGYNPSNMVNPSSTPAIPPGQVPMPRPAGPGALLPPPAGQGSPGIGFSPVSPAQAVPATAPAGPAAGPVPMPQPRPPMAGGGPVPLPTPAPGAPPTPGQGGIGSDWASAAAAGGSAAVPANIAPPGAGMGVSPAPVPVPPAAPPGGAVPTSTQGGLGRALGLMPPGYQYPYPQPNNPIQNALAGFGRGMSAVAALPRGAGGGRAFAAGLGGGLTGGIANQNQQDREQLERQKNFFNETVSADNQYMKGVAFPYQLGYLYAGMQNRMQGGSGNGGGNAWWGSDVGRINRANIEADKIYQGKLKELQVASQSNFLPPEEVQKRYQELTTTGRQQILDQKYKEYRVDPNNYKGSEKDPIDGTKMSDFQLETMPPGTYFTYKDKDGKVQTGQRAPYEQIPNRYAQPPAYPPQGQPGGFVPSYFAGQNALGAGQ